MKCMHVLFSQCWWTGEEGGSMSRVVFLQFRIRNWLEFVSQEYGAPQSSSPCSENHLFCNRVHKIYGITESICKVVGCDMAFTLFNVFILAQDVDICAKERVKFVLRVREFEYI